MNDVELHRVKSFEGRQPQYPGDRRQETDSGNHRKVPSIPEEGSRHPENRDKLLIEAWRR